jgi:pyruvate dehydrogenase E2 component (dihydrolipoamide acetyltransferase)
MPSLGADMDKGIIARWLVSVGSHVKRGDVIVDVETDKGTIAVEIWESGDVEKILVEAGQEVPVGAVLAKIKGVELASQPLTEASVLAAGKSVTAPSDRRIRASPLARRLAAASGIDLAQVKASGIGGAITRADVESAASTTKSLVAPVQAPRVVAVDDAMDRMRRAIGAAMTKSKREIPHYYLRTDINVSKAMAWLGEENRRRVVTDRLLPIALFLKATSTALRSFPEFNGFFVDGEYRAEAAVNLGVAIALRSGGLVAPAIVGCEVASLTEVMHKLQDLTGRARRGKLRSSEVDNPTITVTSLGERGVDEVFGVIYPPQVAMIGLGCVRERPWADHGMIGAVPVLTVTLSADHRVSAGHQGSRFLAAIDALLQSPEAL